MGRGNEGAGTGAFLAVCSSRDDSLSINSFGKQLICRADALLAIRLRLRIQDQAVDEIHSNFNRNRA